jgi:hypothetical protein
MLKKQVAAYIAYCESRGLKPQDYKNLVKFFKEQH